MKVEIDIETAEGITRSMLIDTYVGVKEYLKDKNHHPNDIEMFKNVVAAIEVLGGWYFAEDEFKKLVKKAKTLTEIIEKNKPEIEKVNAYIKSLEDEIAQLKAKTLTDEEIQKLYEETSFFGVIDPIKFAKAILRKAQEK